MKLALSVLLVFAACAAALPNPLDLNAMKEAIHVSCTCFKSSSACTGEKPEMVYEPPPPPRSPHPPPPPPFFSEWDPPRKNPFPLDHPLEKNSNRFTISYPSYQPAPPPSYDYKQTVSDNDYYEDETVRIQPTRARGDYAITYPSTGLQAYKDTLGDIDYGDFRDIVYGDSREYGDSRDYGDYDIEESHLTPEFPRIRSTLSRGDYGDPRDYGDSKEYGDSRDYGDYDIEEGHLPPEFERIRSTLSRGDYGDPRDYGDSKEYGDSRDYGDYDIEESHLTPEFERIHSTLSRAYGDEYDKNPCEFVARSRRSVGDEEKK